MFVTTAFAATNGALAARTQATAGTVVPHAGSEETFPPFDGTLFPSQLLWLLISFLAFYFFLKRVVIPHIAGTLEDRRGQIAGDLDKAAQLKGEADAAVAAYEQALAEARADAGKIAGKARDEAKAAADAERKMIEAGLDKKLAEAEARIAGIKSTALKDVGAVAEESAALIVQQLLGAAPSKGDIAAAVKAVNGQGLS